MFVSAAGTAWEINLVVERITGILKWLCEGNWNIGVVVRE
jgi:hypothetical protein